MTVFKATKFLYHIVQFQSACSRESDMYMMSFCVGQKYLVTLPERSVDQGLVHTQ